MFRVLRKNRWNYLAIISAGWT